MYESLCASCFGINFKLWLIWLFLEQLVAWSVVPAVEHFTQYGLKHNCNHWLRIVSDAYVCIMFTS